MSRRLDERPRLRSDLIAGPHPEDGDRVLVFCPRTGQHFQTSADGWRLAQALDGRRTIAAVIGSAEELTGKEMEPSVFERYLARLDKLGALEGRGAPRPKQPRADRPQRSVIPTPASLPLFVHPAARFSCEGFGTCCESGYAIPISGSQAPAIRRAALSVLPNGKDPLTLLPTESGKPFTFALANEKSCPFLSGDKRCLIHEQPEQPGPCRVFPFTFAVALGRIHASPTHRCLCGLLGRGERLEDQRPALAARLSHAGNVIAVPAQTRLDEASALPTDTALSILLELLAEPRSPFATLLELIDRLLQASARRGPNGVSRALQSERLYARLAAELPAWEDEAVVAIVTGRPHPQKFRLRRALALRKIDSRLADAKLEAGRFLRDHLFGLGLYEASTWARALLALGVGLHRVLWALPVRSSFPAARERIMSLEEALRASSYRTLFGAGGPLASRAESLSAVRRQLERLASDVG